MQNSSCNLRERMEMPRPCDTNFDLRNMALAMAYVPWQYFDTVFEVDKALECGTIFPELSKPFFGKRGVPR